LANKLEALDYEIVKDKYEKNKLVHFSLITAFKSKVFELVDQQDLDLYRVNHDYSVRQEDFRKQNKGTLILLRHRETEQLLVLCNTQLYHKSELDYVRQAQALYVLQQACTFIKKH